MNNKGIGLTAIVFVELMQNHQKFCGTNKLCQMIAEGVMLG